VALVYQYLWSLFLYGLLCVVPSVLLEEPEVSDESFTSRLRWNLNLDLLLSLAHTLLLNGLHPSALGPTNLYMELRYDMLDLLRGDSST